MLRVKFEVPCRLEFWSPGGKSTSIVHMYINVYIYISNRGRRFIEGLYMYGLGVCILCG